MKKSILIIQWIVGLLFIFSGLIKANDPLGLSFKMQEFFEAWHLEGLHNYTLVASVVMNILEVVAGVALIIGWQIKRVSWLLLLLIGFFTFLTSYVLFSGKIHACGCFGDCVPLSPIQTFIKDIVLLLLIVALLIKSNITKQLFSNVSSILIIATSFILLVGLQWYVQKYLPVLDCLPFAKGKNIAEGLKLPPNAVADSVEIIFKYKKDGKIVEFDQNNFPEKFDSTFEYVDRYDKLIRKGNGLALISDFKLTTLSGNDTTQALLNSNSYYVLLLVKDASNIGKWKNDNFELLNTIAKAKKISLFIVTSTATEIAEQITSLPILQCDATVIKTAARVNPTYMFMKGAVIVEKLSYASEKKLLSTFNKFNP